MKYLWYTFISSSILVFSHAAVPASENMNIQPNGVRLNAIHSHFRIPDNPGCSPLFREWHSFDQTAKQTRVTMSFSKGINRACNTCIETFHWSRLEFAKTHPHRKRIWPNGLFQLVFQWKDDTIEIDTLKQIVVQLNQWHPLNQNDILQFTDICYIIHSTNRRSYYLRI